MEDEAIEKTKKPRYAPSVLSVMTLFGFLLFVTPDEGSFLLNLVPMVLIWMTVYFTMGLLFDFSAHRASALSRIVSISSASVCVLVVMFNALGQLAVLDIIALVFLVALGSFYFDRTWRS